MSRIAAYLGPAAPVAAVVERGTNSLLKQAAQAPDGFGIGWYPDDGEPDAIRLVSREPIWFEEHLLSVARRLRSRAIVSSVRRAPPHTYPELSGAQPFQRGPYLFSHSGELTMFREVFERPLREQLSEMQHRNLAGLTDSEVLFATWLDALGDRSGPDAMADALEQTMAAVREIALANGAPARFAIVVSNGHALVALRTATHGAPPPLHTTVAAADAPLALGARLIASEPLFPGNWTALEVHSLTIFTED